MGLPAARMGDMHLCPDVVKSTPPVPHVGGPIVTGCPTVLIGGQPAAVKGDKLVCVGPPDTIDDGSSGVFICGKAAARMGDSCAHHGKIVQGCITVLIGNKGSKGAGASSVKSSGAGSTATNHKASETTTEKSDKKAQAATATKAAVLGSPATHVCPYQS